MYPDLTPKEREYKIVKEKGAVFLMQVGKKLTNGERHDGRAPDYDDWELNGDILVYYPVLDIALELSSMGIRVDETALDKQLTEAGCDDRRELSPVSVCSSCARLILEKYMFPCGLRKCRKKLLKAVFHFCKIESRDQIEYTFFLNTEK